jgi:hypothetical protein
MSYAEWIASLSAEEFAKYEQEQAFREIAIEEGDLETLGAMAAEAIEQEQAELKELCPELFN